MKKTAFIVQSAAAFMPASCRGVYRRVAVLEVELDADGRPVAPKMISKRARGVVDVVATWERLHARGTNTAYARAYREATEYANELNAARA